jgi:diguanylate cyclase (GGDEF)-like protein
MKHRERVKRLLAVGLPLGLLTVNGFFLHSSLNELFQASQWVRQTLQVREALSDIKADLVSAETGQRGYLLTSERLYLAPYEQARVEIAHKLDSLRTAFADDPARARSFVEITTLVDEKFAELEETILTHETTGSDAAMALVRENRGKVIMDRLRLLVSDLRQSEGSLLREREAAYERARTVAMTSFAILMAAIVALFAIVYWIARREYRSSNEAAEQISNYAISLNETVGRLKIERNEIAMLNEAGNFLQSCDTMAEVADLAGPFLGRIFPSVSGGLYIYAASRNQLYAVAEWGEGGHDAPMDAGDCWALRRGKQHHHAADGAAPRCRHHQEEADTVCLPLLAHGEAIGVLALKRAAGAGGFEESTLRLADMLTHQLGLTLSNIRLRETLNDQSIRDPLTNAFNRRYLNMVAEKELAQAKRQGEAVAIAMLDIDHFKRFNDLNGHLAGDVALASVVDHLQGMLRSGDWLFRYGGEEFLIMMRGISVDEARMRFDRMVESVAGLQLSMDERALPKVTISVGLALFPRDGTEFAELVSLADAALYRAKKNGRNQVCMVEREDEPPLLLSA